MILKTGRFAIACALATLSVVPAHADVLQVDGAQARWVAGPAAGVQMSATHRPEEVPATALIVPEDAVADPAAHAGAIPPEYAAKVAEIAARFDLSPALIEAVVWQESRWRENAVSPAGARGLAQLMPGTAREMGVDPDDPLANLEGGARYLREQIDRFDGDIEKALAAYNAGPGRVIRSGGVPRIRETQIYVASVMGRLSDHSRSSE
jgi:soluble lytic murein transglycosylase-like protein